jgi:hypothetical protein
LEAASNLTATSYTLNLTIQCNDATMIDEYLVAIILPEKITSNTTVLLEKIIKN